MNPKQIAAEMADIIIIIVAYFLCCCHSKPGVEGAKARREKECDGETCSNNVQ